jgi:hypothetical protein
MSVFRLAGRGPATSVATPDLRRWPAGEVCALELGEHGITVNAVVPGLLDTALTRHEDRYAQAISETGGPPQRRQRRG